MTEYALSAALNFCEIFSYNSVGQRIHKLKIKKLLTVYHMRYHI